MNGVRCHLIDLHGMCWEAVRFPDALPFSLLMAARVGQDEVLRLQQEARTARGLTGGVKRYIAGDDQDTVAVLMQRLLAEPARTRRLVRAYRTILNEGPDTVGVDVRATDDESLAPDEGLPPPPD